MRHHDVIERRPIEFTRNGETQTWTLEDAPTRLLIYRFLNGKINGSQAMQDRRDAAIELDRRQKAGTATFVGYIAARLAQFISPPCSVCGGKGLYIVGRQTYCSTHKTDARSHLARTRGATCAAKARVYEKESRRVEGLLKHRDRHAETTVARNGRR